MTRSVELEFITPCFSHGATDEPEIRPASIRGQLHAWFRILGGGIAAERRIFGGIKQAKASFQGHDETTASKVVVRVAALKGTTREMSTLPHKNYDTQRKAYLPGTTCRVDFVSRLGLSEDDWKLFNRCVDAWLLMGTLGFRATRAAGSFAWKDASFPMPGDPLAYQDACRDLLDGTPCQVAVLDKAYGSEEKARRDVSDSLGGPKRPDDGDDLKRLHEPLGYVGRRTYDRGAPSRKTSPLKYRLVRFGTTLRLLAFWDGRRDVTHCDEADFIGVVSLLAKRKPAIGEQLEKAFA